MNGIEAGLSLGSNIDDRLQHLQAAREAIIQIPEVSILASAPIYETEPVDVAQEHEELLFYNTVLIVGTSLSVHQLFESLAAIENRLGRKRHFFRRNMPRKIDIDIIYYNGQRIRSGGLVVPHPRWTQRRFVLQPLADVRDKLILPGQEQTVGNILAELPQGQPVKRVMTQW